MTLLRKKNRGILDAERRTDNVSMAKIKGTSEEAMQKIDRPGSLNMHEHHRTDTPPHSRELEDSPGGKKA